MMKKFFYNFLLWIDEGGNVFIIPFIAWLFRLPQNGAEENAHYTISQFCAEQRIQGTKFGCVTCKILTWVFKPFFLGVAAYDHCSEAMKNVSWTEDAG